MSDRERPWIVRALAWTIAPPYRDEIVDDLVDAHDSARRERRGALRANARLLADLVESAVDSRRQARLARRPSTE